MIPKIRNSVIIEVPVSSDGLFGYFAPSIHGFTGVAKSLDDCLKRVEREMQEHILLLEQDNMYVPPPEEHPIIVIVEEGQAWQLKLKDIAAA